MSLGLIKMKTEKVKLFEVYVQDGELQTEITEDSLRAYELFGFLKCYIKQLEQELIDNISPK